MSSLAAALSPPEAPSSFERKPDSNEEWREREEKGAWGGMPILMMEYRERRRRRRRRLSNFARLLPLKKGGDDIHKEGDGYPTISSEEKGTKMERPKVVCKLLPERERVADGTRQTYLMQ